MLRKLLMAMAIASPLAAQSTIDPADRYAHSANAGWIDFRANTTHGVRVSERHLSGFAHAANFGWIDLGDGSPVNGHTYSNSTATDCGVNLSPGGELTGLAYAANVGWITFEQTHGKPMLNLLTGTLSGFAYSANLGWIALDTPSSALITNTLASTDSDNDGIADSYEYLHFGNLTTANAASHSDGDARSDLDEYLANTDPRDADDFLQILSQSHSMGNANVTTLTFTSRPGRVYRIEYDDDFQGTWNRTAPFLPAAGPSTSQSVNHGNPGQYFFRVSVEMPLQP